MTRSARWPVVWLLAAIVGLSACGALDSPDPANVQPLEGGPDYPLFDQSMTWTGEQLIIVGGAGGDMDDGLLVDDPMAWTPDGGFDPIAKPPGLVRNRQGAVWTGDEVLIWSGTSEPYGVGEGILTSAAAYDPATDRWRELADSPEELAKVDADGGMVGRTVVFAGGHAELDERDALVATYDLDRDRWSHTTLSGPAFALAADGEHGFVLWEEGEDRQNPDRSLRPRSVRLGRVEVGDGALRVEPIGLPDDHEGFRGQVGLALIDRSLVLVSETGERSSTLYVADLDAGGDPGSWRQVALDGVGAPLAFVSRRFPIVAVGRQLAVLGPADLHWVDIDDGTVVTETVTSEESCALTTSKPVAVPSGMVAIGGSCAFITDSGEEQQIYGSYLFTPPTDQESP